MSTTVDEANISDLSAGEEPLKSGFGKTGVRLGWHNKADYKKLTKDQKNELRQWFDQHPDQKQTVDSAKKSTPRQKKRTLEKREARHEKRTKRVIMSVLGELAAQQANVSGVTGTSTPQTSNISSQSAPAVTLSELLARISDD